MFVIMGATGHVGSAASMALLEAGQSVTVVTRDAAKGEAWRRKGADVAVADVRDVPSLRAAFQRGRRAFLLNPPADISTDTDEVELRTVACILEALEGSGLEKVVAESTYGARPGHRCGDLNTLYALEEGLRAQAIPAAILRAAYYYSNFDQLVDAARGGVLPSMFPATFKMPMAAPADLGAQAAARLMAPVDDGGITYVEGPERCSFGDVAAAFAKAMDRPVEVQVAPRETWEGAFRRMNFSKAAAHAYARMTEATADDDFNTPSPPILGKVTLQDYIRDLVAKASAPT